MSAPGPKRHRRTRPGFWARPEIRRYLPVAIGVLAMVLLVLTFVVAPRGRRRPAPAAVAVAAPEPATISEESADLRRSPDSRSETVVTLRRGSAVTIEQQVGTWLRVRDGARVGFLPRHSVERDADRALRSRRAEAIFKFAPLSGDVEQDTPLLLAPFSFAAVWGGAGRGESLPVYSVDHGYYATKLPDGTLGFVASEDVDIVPANPAEPALTPGSGNVVREIEVAEQNPVPAPAPEATPPSSGAVFPGMPSDVPAPGLPPGNSTPAAGASGEVAPAVLLQKVDPVYPAGALAARVAGTVVLQISIDRDGTVTRVEVKRPAPLGMTEAAIAAVQRWRYRPATALGGPIPSIKLVRIEFKPPE